MRAARLLALLLALQNHGPRTASALATELEVSVRTIYRDVEALSSAGIPVYAEKGHGGGIRLVDGFQTRLTGLTDQEAGVIGLLGVPAAAQQLGLGAVLGAAQAKIDASLPVELRSRAQRVRERFLLDAPGWFERPEALPCLPAVGEAVWAGRTVELRYRRRPDRPVVRRKVAPLGFQRDLLRERVVIRLPADQTWRLRTAVTAEAAAAAQGSAVPDERDGWVRMTLPVESIAVAHSELLRLAGSVEVLEPQQLRRALFETARHLLAAHTDP